MIPVRLYLRALLLSDTDSLELERFLGVEIISKHVTASRPRAPESAVMSAASPPSAPKNLGN
jgi:hypothetical protein